MTRPITIEPFKPEHGLEIALDAKAARELGWHDRTAALRRFEETVNSFTARDREGRVIFIGGIVERHLQHATLWAAYADGIGRRAWAMLLDRTRYYIAQLPHRRVDAGIEAANAPARRWAERLGMAHEATLAEAAADGGDLMVYRRIEE